MLVLTLTPLGLGQAGVLTTDSPSVGAEIHVLLEWTSVCLSLFTACLGFFYLWARRDVLVSIIAIASLAAGIWDSFHTIASIGLVDVTSNAHDFIPLSSAASRTLRALILTAGVTYLLARPPRSVDLRWTTVALPIAGIAAGAFWFYRVTLTASLPRAHFPDGVVTRPWDLVALPLFLTLGIVLYPLLLKRTPSLLVQALRIEVIPEVLAGVFLSFGSSALYDRSFLVAHALKVVAAFAPLGGICLQLVRSYRREMQAANSMERLVTELKSVEADLRSKEVRLDQLTNNIKEVFWLSSANGGGMHYVSPAYEEIFGLTCESLYRDPSSFLEVVHPEDRGRMVELLSNSPDGDFEIEYRLLRSDGDVRWLRTRGFPFRDATGSVYRLAGITEDVTGRKQTENELRRSEARTRALLRAMPDLMFRMSRSGTILDYHAAPTARLYKPPSEFLGARMGDVIPEVGDEFLRQIEVTLRTGVVQSMGYRLNCDGHLGEYEARFAPSDDEVLVVIRDVTEQYRLEREILDVSHREQERIGHDLHDGISQQLAGIALLTKALQQSLSGKLEAEAGRAQQIATLVDETLIQTKSLARGLAPVELEGGGLASALEALALGVETIHRVRCRWRCHGDVDVSDRATAIHVYRIAQEAVSNALRHARANRIGIELSTSRTRNRLAVSDDGRGIEAGALRATSGMGFHIMRYRSRMIEGTLDVRSDPENGTLVTCEWPNVSAAAAERAPSRRRRVKTES
jgi:PAS domain S-box-containing protein